MILFHLLPLPLNLHKHPYSLFLLPQVYLPQPAYLSD